MKRSIPQGKYISASDTIFYKSLGALIKDYREWRKISQESFASSLGVSVRQLRNWETNRNRVRLDNLHDIAEVTGIPMQVCIVLNADEPVWYSIQKRRFALSLMENKLFHSKDSCVNHEQSVDADLLYNEKITKDKHISMMLACHHDIYGDEKPMGEDVIKAAIRLLPELNRIVFDCWGHYVGHQICLPIAKDVYAEIIKKGTFEGHLTPDRLSNILTFQQGVFFTYSIFSASLNVGYRHNVTNVQYFRKITHKKNYLIAINSATEEGQIHLSSLGFRLAGKHNCLPGKIHSNIYEIELVEMSRILGPFGALGIVMHNESKIKAHTDKTETDGELTVGGYSSVEKGHRNNWGQQYGKEKNTCPNPACNLQPEGGKSYIISNGTYRTKDGTMVRRFLCKECGRSFCSRARSIFSGLRSPQEKVISAFKLLLQGISLRGAAKIIGVDHHTIRNWLMLIAGQSGNLDPLLMEQLKISPIEIEILKKRF